MIKAKAFAGKHYAVLGLARSGLATVAALLASGARVTVWDDKLAPSPLRREGKGEGERGRAERPASNAVHPHPALSLQGEGVKFADLNSADLTQFDSIVVTPGLPLNRHPIAARAREAGVEVIGDIELFARARAELPPHKVVGITGTNGKSTTTALVHHILQTAGVPSLMGGNIGLPILAQEPLPEGGVYVLELSSYQLDLTQSLDCEVAVLLNITPDHLDRYDGFKSYAASKARLFEMQSPSNQAIVALDDSASRAIAQDIGDRVVPVSTTQGWDWRGVRFAKTGFLKKRWRLHIDGDRFSEQDWPALQGPHNAQNAAAAAAVAGTLRIAPWSLANGLKTYPGLPHRMERVRDRNGVLFVNDSKATNPTAAAPALATFPAVRWILGGQAKSDDLDECAPHFSHVRKAYTIGEASALFAALLKPHMAVAECGTLDAAVTAAAADAQPGETVLLSPACASFDQFTDFEARGDAFRAAVEAL